MDMDINEDYKISCSPTGFYLVVETIHLHKAFIDYETKIT